MSLRLSLAHTHTHTHTPAFDNCPGPRVPDLSLLVFRGKPYIANPIRLSWLAHILFTIYPFHRAGLENGVGILEFGRFEPGCVRYQQLAPVCVSLSLCLSVCVDVVRACVAERRESEKSKERVCICYKANPSLPPRTLTPSTSLLRIPGGYQSLIHIRRIFASSQRAG